MQRGDDNLCAFRQQERAKGIPMSLAGLSGLGAGGGGGTQNQQRPTAVPVSFASFRPASNTRSAHHPTAIASPALAGAPSQNDVTALAGAVPRSIYASSGGLARGTVAGMGEEPPSKAVLTTATNPSKAIAGPLFGRRAPTTTAPTGAGHSSSNAPRHELDDDEAMAMHRQHRLGIHATSSSNSSGGGGGNAVPHSSASDNGPLLCRAGSRSNIVAGRRAVSSEPHEDSSSTSIEQQQLRGDPSSSSLVRKPSGRGVTTASSSSSAAFALTKDTSSASHVPAPAPSSSSSYMASGGPRQMPVLLWQCQECLNGCNVMKSENRCICGHRFREHDVKRAADKFAATSTASKCPCTVAKCICKDFFYMVAEGAWIVRCRCKHKHTEHDANFPYLCTKCKPPPAATLAAIKKSGVVPSGGSQTGACCGFDSPFVCNCNHPWSSHKQVWELRTLTALPQVLDDFGDPSLVKRGLDDDC